MEVPASDKGGLAVAPCMDSMAIKGSELRIRDGNFCDYTNSQP